MVGLRKVQNEPSSIASRGPVLPTPVLSTSDVESLGPTSRLGDSVARPVGLPATDLGVRADSDLASNARSQMTGHALVRAQHLYAQVGGSNTTANNVRTAVENDPNFKNLSADDQAGIRKLMISFGNDVDALNNIKNLVTKPGFMGHAGLFKSPGFARLDAAQQKAVIDQLQDFATKPQQAHNLVNLITAPEFDRLGSKAIARLVNYQLKHPNDANLNANFRDLASGQAFQTLGEPGRSRVVGALISYKGDPVKTDNLKNMVNATDLVPTSVSLRMLEAHFARPENTQLPADFKRVSDRSDFRSAPEETQHDVLNEISNGNGGPINADNVLNLFLEPRFQNVWGEARYETLNALKSAYDGVRLDPKNMDNLLTLAESPGFDKLDSKIQRYMIDTLSRRPDNKALAEALRDLANDGGFRADRRNHYVNIDKVDSSVP